MHDYKQQPLAPLKPSLLGARVSVAAFAEPLQNWGFRQKVKF